MKHIRNFFSLLRGASGNFLEDDGLKLSASLSYYMIFSIAPLIIIVMGLAGVFLGPEAVQGKIYWQINGLVGNSTALQIQEIIKNIETTHNSVAGTIVGIIVLLVGVTGIFTEIQHSINYIWSVRAKPKRGWIKILLNRLLSFSLILSLGFILLVALLVDGLSDLLNDKIKLHFPNASLYVFKTLNLGTIFLSITSLFAIIFKVLPDAKIMWKDSFIGALMTAFLFMMGKWIISYYVGKLDVGLTYGTAASIIILLLWVYYSSIILFFGAEFTRLYALHYGGGVKPYSTSVFIIKQEAKEIELSPLNRRAANVIEGPPESQVTLRP